MWDKFKRFLVFAFGIWLAGSLFIEGYKRRHTHDDANQSTISEAR
jgi:hypothetical protein